MERKRKVGIAVGAAFAVWLSVCFGALLWIARYSNAAGPETNGPARWPQQSRISLSPTNLTLVLLGHPRCPCMAATLGELERIMARAHGHLTAHILFIQPAGHPSEWSQTSLWRRAAAIPNATVEADPAGVEAEQFNAQTAGDTLVYATDGRLLFQGGITISRGHSGDNPGRDAILAALNGNSNGKRNPVFGCSLFENKNNLTTKL